MIKLSILIDITPYQQRLEWAKEWIEARIDGHISPPIWVNLESMPFKFSVEQVIRIYEQCGILFTPKEVIHNPMMAFTFEEYCEYKKLILS